MSSFPVITIDGPSASGKGSVALSLARNLRWHYLDSGALYRISAYILFEEYSGSLLLNLEKENNFDLYLNILLNKSFSFEDGRSYLGEKDISEKIRLPEIAELASQIALFPEIRSFLVEKQRSLLQSPGMILDGRDAGSVVFPNAPLKVFLTADLEVRAKRRKQQLKSAGIICTDKDVLFSLNERDKRDSNRNFAPLLREQDAILIDSTHLELSQVVEIILNEWRHIIGS